MIYLYLLASCIAFIELFIALDVQREAVSLLTRSVDAMKVFSSQDLDDDEKEAFMRRASLEMFKSTFLFVGKFLFIVVVLYLTYFLTVTMFPSLRIEILDHLVSPVTLIGLTALAAIYIRARNAALR